MTEHIQARTLHARKGAIKNAFEYGVDFVLTDLSNPRLPWVLSHNRRNLWSLWDKNHGGERGNGSGVSWFRDLLASKGFPHRDAELLLLTQPSFLWLHFNPVSFWIAVVDGHPCAFVAEVNNTFGHRHCYFCAHPDFGPILRNHTMMAEKLMHVSPFQQVEGQYLFNFGLTDQGVDIRISYQNGPEGVLATLTGPRKTATSGSLIWAAIRRPLGALRVLTLIHWQALKLYFKKAPFFPKAAPPNPLVSDNIPPS